MTVWRKSSHSGGSSTHSDCVEVSRLNGAIAFRDSKAPEAGQVNLAAASFVALVTHMKKTDQRL